jgi:sulfofructose kinase
MFDVVGVGANSVDYVYRLPAFPAPDSPTAKLRIAHHAISCGGQTATTLCVCAAMGLRSRYVGATGTDDRGRLMRDELSRRGVDLAHARVRETTNAFAVILLDDAQGERVVLWDRESGLDLAPDDIDPGVIRDARLLHVDDVDVEAAIRAASMARDAGIPVTSDIERVGDRIDALIAAVTIPIFAEHVLEPLTGERDFERALRAIQRQRARLPPSLLRSFGGPRRPNTTYGGMACVTLGARGAMLLDGDRLHHEPAFQVAVSDTTGAGDVFRGAFIAALLRGDAPGDILRFANAAAAISCTRLGAINGVPTLDETLQLLAAPSTTKHTTISKDTNHKR